MERRPRPARLSNLNADRGDAVYRALTRLEFEAGLTDREVATSVGASRSTIQECLRRARETALGWPLPDELDEAALLARLYPRAPTPVTVPLPDYTHIHRELSRRGVTRELLWHEYKSAHPDGLQYTAFCNHYRRWRASQAVVFRQVHAPGDKFFVDYAGHTMPVIDPATGEVRHAQLFVAVLGCSDYTYAEATGSQTLPDWLASHVRALNYFGGVPRAMVPDNLKSAVTRALRYEPDLNPAYPAFAEHYGVAILPARVRKPRDKAKVEAGVLICERWILARLRDRTFFSLAALNDAIAVLLEDLDNRAPRGITPAQLAQVTDLAWIRQHFKVFICGPTGVGKSFLAAALAHAVCRADHVVRCFRLPRLVDELARHGALHKRSTFFRQLAKVDLLVLDDFGITPLSDTVGRDLLEPDPR